MDAFVSRKKRKLSSTEQAPTIEDISALSAPDDESTDFKLALLSSLHPYIEQQVLLDILLAHDGSVETALASLKPSDSPPRKPSAAPGYQSSLSTFVAQIYSFDGSSKRAKLLSKKGKTLHLYDPADVAAHTPCSIIHNFLPPEVATELLEELLKEAPTFERMTFKLFDNVVQSPHTACFYVESYEEMQKQKTDYIYNGGLLTVGADMATSKAIYLPRNSEAQSPSFLFHVLTYPGCSTTHSSNAESLSLSSKGSQLRDHKAYQGPLPQRPKAQASVPPLMET
jgi:hypothetical protein